MYTAIDIALRIFNSQFFRRVALVAGRAVMRQAVRELSNRVLSGETRPASRRYRRQPQRDNT